MSTLVDNETILPKGVTRLRNGKYRFKREAKKYGLKLDRVDDSFKYIKRMADNFESTLQHYKKVDADTKYSVSHSNRAMKNIHKRGNQYYVEFIIDGVLHTPIVTHDLEKAVEVRDEFRNNMLSEKEKEDERKRREKLNLKMQEAKEGMLNFDYEKLKSALNFLEPHEFLAATYDIDTVRKD